MAQGKELLKIFGILMIVSGSMSFLMFGVMGALAAFAVASGATAAFVQCILAILSGVMQLACGIAGVVNCGKPEKAVLCFWLGVSVAIVSVASFVMHYINAGFDIVSLIVSLIVPGVFIYGALLNKKSAK